MKKYLQSFFVFGTIALGILFLNTNVFGAFYQAGGTSYRLQTSLGSTDTTIRLSSFKEPVSNTPFTMTYLNSAIEYGTLDPQVPGRTEFVSFTGITQNSDGTASLTGVSRGLAGSYPYTASTTLRNSHAGQSIFIMSNTPAFYNEFSVRRNDESISGLRTFTGGILSTASSSFSAGLTISNLLASTFNGLITVNATTTYSAFGGVILTNQPINNTDAANKLYVDSVALVSAPNASVTVKGVAEEATQAEIEAGTGAGGTAARLFMNPSTYVTSAYAQLHISTTTTLGVNYATTTITGLLPNKIYDVYISVGSTTPQSVGPKLGLVFNNDRLTNVRTTYINNGGGETNTDAGYVDLSATNGISTAYMVFHIDNLTNHRKRGTFEFTAGALASGFDLLTATTLGGFEWATTTDVAISSISIGMVTGSTMASTTIDVYQK